MVKFTRVQDPERVKDGDLLVFPAGETKLNLKPSTFGDLGLSVGHTCRSANSPKTVASWLSRSDGSARLFMIVNTLHKFAPQGDALLLTMEACLECKIPDVPHIYDACLVPFGPKLWTWGEWAACWNHTHENSVTTELAAKVGIESAISDMRSGKADRYMNQVWDGDNRLNDLLGDPAGNELSRYWFPRRSEQDKFDRDAFDTSSLMAWTHDRYSKSSRIRFATGFLTKLAKRGAKVLRPNEEFEKLVTASIVSWYCREMQERFLRRVTAGRTYIKGLLADIQRDVGRAHKYGVLSRKLDRLGPRLSRETLKGTGVSV